MGAFLEGLGISQLYSHQARAADVLLDGGDVLVTTGTSSGKSLCYQIPVLETLLADPAATALLVFPMKALARDQVAAWNRGLRALGRPELAAALRAHAFDGDSAAADRRTARDGARILVTNPEMVHANLLPGHARWQRFFHGLRFVVLDEVHTYTGFFGANMANVLRRLERVCDHYGGRPQMVCLSATVGNPADLATALTDRQLTVVAEDGSPCGARTFVFWNPPRIKKRRWRGRRSANVEAHDLMAGLVRERVATICFSKARTTAEMIYRYVRESLQAQAPGLADRVIPYRGGYAPAERRAMERRLREGEILGVSATRALELGIDIGVLEACIIIGYPGLLSAFFQQAGRAGRSRADSVCFLVGVDTPLNQYVMKHPEYVFERPLERVVVDRDNPFVTLGHVRCAAAELAVADTEHVRFGYAAEMALSVLAEAGKVHHCKGAWYHSANEQPAFEVRLRGYGDESTVVLDADSGEVIDRMPKFRSLRLFYEGAVYLKYGDTYAMVNHDTDRNVVTVRRVDLAYYTDPLTGTAVDHVDAILDQKPLGTATACLGEVNAVLDTPLYERVKFYTLDRISQHPTNQPSIAYEAMSVWLVPPDDLIRAVWQAELDAEQGMKGILYCVSKILPLFLTCDINDFDWSLGSRNSSPNAMFWYEFYSRGIGDSEQCFERLDEILHTALEHLLTCDCDDGCPNCTSRPVTPYHVRNIELGEAGKPESRKAAVVILNGVLNGCGIAESLALFHAPRSARGQQFLPSVVNEPRLSTPNRVLLTERTRGLMRRKLERERAVKPDLDHRVAPSVPVGLPAAEQAETLAQSDSERRSGVAAIRRKGDGLSKRLHQRLDALAPRSRSSRRDAPSLPGGDANQRAGCNPDPPAPEEHAAASPVRLGDSLASRARRLKRSRDGDKPPPATC